MTVNPPTHKSIRRPETEVIAEYIDDGVGHIHIAGEPGIGKTTTLKRMVTDVQDEYEVDMRNIGAHHSLDDLYRKVCYSLYNHLPDDQTETGRRLTGLSIGPVGGISWDTDEPEASGPRFGPRDALVELTELFPEDHQLLICLDDVHELGDDERAIRGAIEETAETLPPEIILITAGRLAFNDVETAVSLDTFTEEQTALLLRKAFPEIDQDRIQTMHERVSGHPLYLGLLIESNDEREALELPENEVQTEIEERYLRFLSPDERRILQATAPLHELNEAVCTYVLPDDYDLDRVAVADILESLSTRIVVQTVGRNPEGLKTFNVHDVFRNFLEKHWNRTDETSHRAFQYYAEATIELTGENRSLETEVRTVTTCLEFISDSVIHTQDDMLSDLIREVLTDDGLSFYPASLLVTNFKTRDADQLPAPVVKSVLESVEARRKVTNDFYDEHLHISWAERQFERGAFNNPSDVLRTYLGRITDSHPSFVRRVIERTTTDDEQSQRYLIWLGTDLPADDARIVGEKTAQWIPEPEAYHELVGPALELTTHLSEQCKFNTALELLDAIITPRSPDDSDQLQGNQGMTRYRLIQTLDATFDDLLTARDSEFIDLLKTNLETALLVDKEDGDDHEVIARQSAITALNYIEQNRGDLKHLLLEYFTLAVTEWTNDDPTGPERRELVDELLDSPDMFRRVGFSLLAAHPAARRDAIETELLDPKNYRELPVGYEFYRLLATGFGHLDDEHQEKVCEIISDGPYADYEHQAKQIAAREQQPASYFEQRIQEKWRRDRFFMIQDELPEQYAGQLTELLEKYGDPDRLPSEPARPSITGGMVNERGPEQTEELRDRPAEEILTTAVEWNPPEPEIWNTDETGKLEERNHIGFSRQIGELIKEQPARYAREISILEDAPSRYAEEALRTFRELLDDGQTFPWSSIIELGQTITEEPTAWNSGCRTNLATLFNKGMAAEQTDFPHNQSEDVREILLILLNDPDPDQERDQPAEEMAGHGDPVQVAINSVRPMALNAFITYTWWTTQQEAETPDRPLLDAIEKRITDDPSLAVRTVIGRRFRTLWAFDQDLVEHRLKDIFPRGNTTMEQRRFIAAWNSYTRHNVNGERYETLRPYYIHAIELLDTPQDEAYDTDVRSTAAHILSSYLFGEESLSDEESLIARYYNEASPADATKLASTLANSIEKPEIEDRWATIRELWDWRLNQIKHTSDTKQQEHNNEIRQFLDCVRESSVTDMAQEQDKIRRSLPRVAIGNHHWRQIEEWLADQADSHPATVVELYKVLVDAAAHDDWPSTVRTSQTTNRERIYEHATMVDDETLQTTLQIANLFAAERCEMDRAFLDEHL